MIGTPTMSPEQIAAFERACAAGVMLPPRAGTTPKARYERKPRAENTPTNRRTGGTDARGAGRIGQVRHVVESDVSHLRDSPSPRAIQPLPVTFRITQTNARIAADSRKRVAAMVAAAVR